MHPCQITLQQLSQLLDIHTDATFIVRLFACENSVIFLLFAEVVLYLLLDALAQVERVHGHDCYLFFERLCLDALLSCPLNDFLWKLAIEVCEQLRVGVFVALNELIDVFILLLWLLWPR